MDYLHAALVALVRTLTALTLKHDNHGQFQPPLAYARAQIRNKAS